jgi:hypothetical protein
VPQYERVFQVLEYLPDGEKPTESPGWHSPERPTFIRGATAKVASVPACAKFATTFSGLRLLVWQEEAPYPPGAVWLVETPIDSSIGVAEELIDSPQLTSTIVPPPLSPKAQVALDRKLNGVAHKPKKKKLR